LYISASQQEASAATQETIKEQSNRWLILHAFNFVGLISPKKQELVVINWRCRRILLHLFAFNAQITRNLLFICIVS